MLLRHLSPEGAERFGVTIHAEVMIDGAHSRTMIVDGPEHAKVTEFMAPFAKGEAYRSSPPTTARQSWSEARASSGF